MRVAALRLLLLVGVSTLTFSCSTTYHCKRCLSGATVKRDTVFRDTTLITHSVRIDSVFRDIPGDTVRLYKDRLQVKYVRLAGRVDSVWIQGECLPDTLKIQVPVLVENEIKTGVATSRVWLIALGMFLVGAGVVAILMMVRH